MILNSKQLEELESIHDSVVEFEDDATNTEGENFDEGAESALAWRRGMIEKAAANVKKIHKKPIDPQGSYALGALLFDRAAKHFGRVTDFSPGKLQITYLRGGEASIKQDQSHLMLEEIETTEASLPREKAKPKSSAPEKKAAPAKTNTTAKEKIQPVSTPKKKETQIRETKPVKSLIAKESPAPAPIKKKAVALKPVEKALQKPTLKTVTKTKTPQKVEKTTLKKVAKSKTQKKRPLENKKQKPPVKANKKVSGKVKASAYIPHGTISDPVADPNGYIKQYFRLMSNKELANVTGLSEHTIRRKLGEWGLKRLK